MVVLGEPAQVPETEVHGGLRDRDGLIALPGELPVGPIECPPAKEHGWRHATRLHEGCAEPTLRNMSCETHLSDPGRPAIRLGEVDADSHDRIVAGASPSGRVQIEGRGVDSVGHDGGQGSKGKQEGVVRTGDS